MKMTLTKKDIETLKGLFMTKDEFNEFKNMVLTNFDKLFKMFETREILGAQNILSNECAEGLAEWARFSEKPVG